MIYKKCTNGLFSSKYNNIKGGLKSLKELKGPCETRLKTISKKELESYQKKLLYELP